MANGLRLLTGIWTIAAVSLLTPGSSRGNEDSCLSQTPLVDARPEDLRPLPPSGASLGSWTLPVSGNSADLLTAAKLYLSIENEGASGKPAAWLVRVSLVFDDPEGWGLPFHFDHLEVRWEDSSGPQRQAIAWSDHCRATGINLFPGTSYSHSIRLRNAPDGLRNIRVRLWGNR